MDTILNIKDKNKKANFGFFCYNRVGGNMKRICIIGGSGSGKTTLATNLGKQLNYPVYHIDGIHHLPNWQERDADERDKIIKDKIKGKTWITDGTYTSTLECRFEKADCIIYLDFSTFTQVKGVLKRFIKYRGRERKEIPGCKERMSLKFLIWVIKWRKRKRKIILEKLSKLNQEKVHIFTTRKQLNKWYENEFNTKMIIN